VIRLHASIEARLRRTAQRWSRLRFSERLAMLASGFGLGLLMLGIAVWRGMIRSPLAFGLVVAALVVAGGLAFLIISISILITRLPRTWLASHLEAQHPALLDRLNTLVYLESREQAAASDAYFERIQAQAAAQLATERPGSPFTSRRALWSWAVALTLAVGTASFYLRTSPWQRLTSHADRSSIGGGAELNLKLPAPETTEQKSIWGEVRITEPGRDLKVTKVDVVPLQIEAASSGTLDKSLWFTATGASPALPHSLPRPADPHHAVYKPLLYVDELRLSDWDVLSYHASASTTEGGSYGSEVYFLEVRPFREDILKLPGGEAGDAYQMLSELTGLIDRQKHVIRETHGFEQRVYELATLRLQDRAKLAAAEGDLAEATRHLYARIASRMENQDVGVVLDQLAQAEEHLAKAAGALRGGDSSAAALERQALAALVATRKALQKAITDNPGGFGGGDSGDGAGGEDTPVADLPDKLKEISEFRDEEKAAREFLDKLVADQRRVAERASQGEKTERPGLADEQQRMRASLREFETSHPRQFVRAEREATAADRALDEASRSLRDAGSSDVAGPQRRALTELESLRRAVGQAAEGRQLTQAYRLKQILDEKARQLRRFEVAPEQPANEEIEREADEAKRTTRELKKLVDDSPVGEAFGLPLLEALSEAHQEERERKLDALTEATDAATRKLAAGRARSDLEQLSGAFGKSEPAVVRGLRESDPLSDTPMEALERALRQIEALVAQAESGKARDPKDAARQRRQALADLRRGTEDRHGKDERTARLLLRAEEELTRVDLKVDAPRLRKLLDEIEQFRLEMTDRALAKKDLAQLRHIDVSRLPPAYRERIQRYFQRLSEQP
jgi:hypothetical protein